MKILQQVRSNSVQNLPSSFAESEVPPFPIEENSKTKDEIRLKYRYLDLKKTGSSEKYDDEEQSNAAYKTVLYRRGIPGD